MQTLACVGFELLDASEMQLRALAATYLRDAKLAGKVISHAKPHAKSVKLAIKLAQIGATATR